MKNLILIIALSVFSFNARAEFIGGVLKSTNGKKMAVECSQKFTSGACSEVNVLIKWNRDDQFEVMETISLDEVDMEEVRRTASRQADSDLNSSYATAVYIGFIGGAAMTWAGSPLGVPAMIVGGIVDIAKAPLVGLLYLTHKGSDLIMRKRINTGLKFMFNPKKQGKELRLRNRYFKNLRSSLYQ